MAIKIKMRMWVPNPIVLEGDYAARFFIYFIFLGGGELHNT